MRGDLVAIAMQVDFGKPRSALVKKDKVGYAFGRLEPDTLIEVERCLAVFLGIAK